MSGKTVHWQGDVHVNVKNAALTLRQAVAGLAMKGAQAVLSTPMAVAEPNPPPVWNCS
jgi:hypothetical protein